YDAENKGPLTIDGKIKSESAAGITIKPAVGAAREIPAADIVDVDYEMGGAKLDYRRAVLSEKSAEAATKAGERKKAVKEALKNYQGVLDQLTDEKVKQHVRFKIARLTARQAEDDPGEMKTAIGLL